jgi:glutaminase
VQDDGNDRCALREGADDSYAKFKDLLEGKNADYIPALAKVDRTYSASRS